MRTLAGLLAATSILALASNAQADGFVSAGIGSDASITGDLASTYATSDATRSTRIAVGERFGAMSVEAVLFGSQLQHLRTQEEDTTVSLGLDAKYHVGLIGGLEVFGKIGLAKTWLTSEAGADGVGSQLGLGLQYNFNVALTEIGLWADYTVQNTELHDNAGASYDSDLKMLNFGVSVGL